MTWNIQPNPRVKNDNEMQALAREVRDLKRQIAQIPSRILGGGGSNPLTIVRIVGGNTIYTGLTGIKYVSTAITSTPAYDPDVDTSFIDGIGRALKLDGSNEHVLILNDPTCYFSHGFPIAWIMKIDLASPYKMPISGGGGATQNVYRPTWY